MTQAAFLELCSVAIGCGLAAAVGVAGLSLIELVKSRLWARKNQKQTVHLCDGDGIAYRSYCLTGVQLARLLADLDREHASR